MAPYDIKLKIRPNSTVSDNFPSEGIKITTNVIGRCGTHSSGTVFTGWTNMKERKVSQFQTESRRDQGCPC